MRIRLADSRSSRKPSAKPIATRKCLTLGLSVLVALLFAGLPALRRVEFSRRVSAQQGITPSALGILFVVDSTGEGDNSRGRATWSNESTKRLTAMQAVLQLLAERIRSRCQSSGSTSFCQTPRRLASES